MPSRQKLKSTASFLANKSNELLSQNATDENNSFLRNKMEIIQSYDDNIYVEHQNNENLRVKFF